MFNFILLIMRAILLLYPAWQMDMVVENAILKKENEILKRKKKKRIKFNFSDRLFYTIICKLLEKATRFVTLIKPDTVLGWQRDLIMINVNYFFLSTTIKIPGTFYFVFAVAHRQ